MNYLYSYVNIHMYNSIHMRLENNLWAWDFPFHDEDPRNVSQVGLVAGAEPMLSQSSVPFRLLL